MLQCDSDILNGTQISSVWILISSLHFSHSGKPISATRRLGLEYYGVARNFSCYSLGISFAQIGPRSFVNPSVINSPPSLMKDSDNPCFSSLMLWLIPFPMKNWYPPASVHLQAWVESPLWPCSRKCSVQRASWRSREWISEPSFHLVTSLTPFPWTSTPSQSVKVPATSGTCSPSGFPSHHYSRSFLNLLVSWCFRYVCLSSEKMDPRASNRTVEVEGTHHSWGLHGSESCVVVVTQCKDPLTSHLSR